MAWKSKAAALGAATIAILSIKDDPEGAANTVNRVGTAIGDFATSMARFVDNLNISGAFEFIADSERPRQLADDEQLDSGATVFLAEASDSWTFADRSGESSRGAVTSYSLSDDFGIARDTLGR